MKSKVKSVLFKCSKPLRDLAVKIDKYTDWDWMTDRLNMETRLAVNPNVKLNIAPMLTQSLAMTVKYWSIASPAYEPNT